MATAMQSSSTHPESLSMSTLPKQSRSKSNPSTVKSRKDASLAITTHPESPTNPISHLPASQSQVKNITRKSSKPIINWFQRKLAGSRARRASEGETLRSGRTPTRIVTPKEKRKSSAPPPVSSTPARQRSGRSNGKPQPYRASSTAGQNAISLDSDSDLPSVSERHSFDYDDRRRTSSVLESTWSPNSLYEADEDASVRPIPPSAPPSPSPSHSSSSYLSHPRTFASMAASTKPTTLLSIDLTGGMAHIAQAPPTPTVPAHRIPPHTRTHSTGVSSGGSITFSLLPPASPSRPTSSSHGQMPSVSSRVQGQASLQAPQHTTHHPRNNPRPSSPPPDDASVLTLASSAFGFPGARAGAFGRSGRTSVADDSISHFSHPHGGGDSTSQFLLGDGDADDDRTYEERYTYGDVDASVRALRPRSSRRGSWESEASGWSARLTGAQAGTSVNPKERSILTNGSQKTGARSVQTEDGEADAEDKTKDMHVENESKPAKYGPNASESFKAEVSDNVLVVTPSTDATSPPETPSAASVSAPADKLLETPKGTPLTLDDAPVVPQHLDAASLAQA